MPKTPLPRIISVKVGKKPETLHIQWDQAGKETLVDVFGILATFSFYAPLRQSPELFGSVRVGEFGTDVVWPGELDMSADTLWYLAWEQLEE